MEIDAMKMELRRIASFINRRWVNSLECRRGFEKRGRGDEEIVRNYGMIGNKLLAFLWLSILEEEVERVRLLMADLELHQRG